MKFFLACATVAIVLIVLSVVRRAADPWEEYKIKYGKRYSETHDVQRKQLFLATDAFIKKHNSQKNATFLMEHNRFSDMTPAELKKYHGLIVKPANRTRSLESQITIGMKDQTLPTSLDYRSSNCMPAVKYQGECGSCWAFGALAPLEFAWCKKYGTLVVLSEQHLIDCDTTNKGCRGGDYIKAWNHLKNVAGGSAKQSLYPYTGKEDCCAFAPFMIGARISDYLDLPSFNVANMQQALQAFGPISVGITVADSFRYYASGVYSDPACENVEAFHAVVVVGYGIYKPWFSKEIDYWIVRNSWGSSWGSAGYILMERGVNRCQIESYPAAVIV